MPSPRLNVVVDIPIEIQTRCEGIQSVKCFIVERPGHFCGRYWALGDVVVCDGTGAVGDVVVLVTSGQGRPRLGGVMAHELRGDLGEPCHPSRWLIAGRVRGVWQRTTIGWVFGSLGLSYSQSCVASSDKRAVKADERSPIELTTERLKTSHQLLLFAPRIAQAA
jgi:hypothetical protein